MTPPDEAPARASFEAWIAEPKTRLWGILSKDEDGEYYEAETRIAWTSWLAAWNAAIARQGAPVTFISDAMIEEALATWYGDKEWPSAFDADHAAGLRLEMGTVLLGAFRARQGDDRGDSLDGYMSGLNKAWNICHSLRHSGANALNLLGPKAMALEEACALIEQAQKEYSAARDAERGGVKS